MFAFFFIENSEGRKKRLEKNIRNNTDKILAAEDNWLTFELNQEKLEVSRQSIKNHDFYHQERESSQQNNFLMLKFVVNYFKF